MGAEMFWLDDFWLETKGTINHWPKNFCPHCIFKNFVAFSEYVNFSFVLQKFHRLVSFENVDAIRVNLVINSKGHRVVSFENGDAIRVKLVINSKGCHLC